MSLYLAFFVWCRHILPIRAEIPVDNSTTHFCLTPSEVVVMPKSLRLERCLPSTSSASGVLLPDHYVENDPIIQTILEAKASECKLSRHEKLVKLSSKSSCQVHTLPHVDSSLLTLFLIFSI